MKIKVTVDKEKYAWDWCKANLKLGTWRIWFSYFVDIGSTFEFDRKEDATFFVLACS